MSSTPFKHKRAAVERGWSMVGPSWLEWFQPVPLGSRSGRLVVPAPPRALQRCSRVFLGSADAVQHRICLDAFVTLLMPASDHEVDVRRELLDEMPAAGYEHRARGALERHVRKRKQRRSTRQSDVDGDLLDVVELG